jgi:hypothetical protein
MYERIQAGAEYYTTDSNAGVIGPETKLGEGKKDMNASELSKVHLDNEDFQVRPYMYHQR